MDRLVRWFHACGLALAENASMTLITGGRSNLTYRIEDKAGHAYVLRRPPRGPVVQSAHDVAREHRILTALCDTDVPVPLSYGLCTDPGILGAPFYVMNLVPGAVLASDADGLLCPYDMRPVASRELVDALARIHLLDVDMSGLGGLGRRDDYAKRQLRRWLRQFHSTTRRTLPLVKEVHDQLVRTMPPQRFTGLVHGDYRPGNVLLDNFGKVTAVLDWELATLGDTMADLGWLTAYWRQPGEIELLSSPTAHIGWWSRDQVVERYREQTGRDLSDLGWYQAFALWRLTCISEGIYARYRDGAMDDDEFDVDAQADHVLLLAEASRDALDSMS